MKTTKLHEEYIKDEFLDCVYWASKIIGCQCKTTQMQGDPEKKDMDGTKYQIVPDPWSADTNEDRIKYHAFEEYFYENFGKWQDSAYFDTPSTAFVAVIKAWTIWENYLEDQIKQTYLDRVKQFHQTK